MLKKKDVQKTLLFGFATAAALAFMASASFACVVFMGTMTVVGADGQTTVTGGGSYHGYCSGGEPKTAAAGSPGSGISLSVAPAPASSLCADTPSKPNRLPNGTYDVRINREMGYTGVDVDLGGAWVFKNGTGCFISANSDTTTTLGTFSILGGTGTASTTVTLDNFNPPNGYTRSGPTDAAVFCVGPADVNPDIAGGMLAPFQLTPLKLTPILL